MDHSLYDPLCSSLIHKFVDDINLNLTNAKAPSLSEDQMLPSYAPSFEDEDDLFECNIESVSSDKEFIWTRINDNMHYEGIATNCQINHIVSLTCKNFIHLCIKDKDGQSTCHRINRFEGDDKDRCNSTHDDDCSYNHVGSSASCFNEDKSSEKSSSTKSSRSSGRKSSSKSREIDPMR